MRLALEISRSRCAALLANTSFSPIETAQVAFSPSQNAATRWLETVKIAREVCFQAAIEPANLTGIGLAFEGAISPHGIVRKSAFSLGFEGYDLRRGLREHLSLPPENWPDEKLRIATRIEAQGVGEARFGGLQRLENWLFLDLDGIGASVGARGGQLFANDLGALILERDGPLDANGKRGTLRAFCSASAFEARCRSYALDAPSKIWKLAPDNFAAQSLASDFASRLAQGLCGAVATFAPQGIALGGAFLGEIWGDLERELRSFLHDYAPFSEGNFPRIELAQTGADAALLGGLVILGSE